MKSQLITIITGRLITDVTIDVKETFTVAKFTLATGQSAYKYRPEGKGRNKPQLWTCNYFINAKQVEFITKHFRKGAVIETIGYIEQQKREDGKIYIRQMCERAEIQEFAKSEPSNESTPPVQNGTYTPPSFEPQCPNPSTDEDPDFPF